MTACIRTVLFDLDGCLYPIANGVEERVRQNLFRWMVSELGVADVTLAEELWRVAFRRFNQGMRGLKAAGYRFDEDAYWRACRDGSTALLSPAPGVVALLERLRARGTRCWVLTNCREREVSAECGGPPCCC